MREHATSCSRPKISVDGTRFLKPKMPYRRRYRRRRRTRRPRRFRRSRRAGRIRRSLGGNRLFAKQKVNTQVDLASGTPYPYIAGPVAFALDAIDPAQLTAFTRLFDQYKILGVGVRFNLVPTSIAVGAVAPLTICTSYDYDSGPAPTTWGDLLQRANCKTQTLSAAGSTSAVAKRFFKPRPLSPVYRPAVTSAYSIGNRKAWLDLAYTDVPYFGLIWGLNSAVGSSFPELTINIETTYYLAFSQVR